MWKFLIPALIASTAAFAQAPNQGQPSTQGQPGAAQSGVTTLNPQDAQGQPGTRAAPLMDPKLQNRNLAIQQIEQGLQMLKQNQQ
jgi:hypothetical protein